MDDQEERTSRSEERDKEKRFVFTSDNNFSFFRFV